MNIPFLSGLQVSGKVNLKNLLKVDSATKILTIDANGNVSYTDSVTSNVDLSNYFTKTEANNRFLTVESDTLDSVLGRGNTSSKDLTLSGVATFSKQLNIPTSKNSSTSGAIWIGSGSTSAEVPLVGNINDLQDVTITNVTNGQGLVYLNGQWVNQNIAVDLSSYYTKTEGDSRYLLSSNFNWTNITGKPTKLSQFTNDLPVVAETDTLNSVTSRGNSTSNNINLNGKTTISNQLVVPVIAPAEKVSGSIYIGDGATAGIPVIADSDKNFEYTQNTPSSVWVINHGLNKRPSVTIMDSAGTIVVGEVHYSDKNNLTITFSAGFTGTATLN